MSLFQDLYRFISFARFHYHLRLLSNGVSESMKFTTSCATGLEARRDDSAEDAAVAMRLKIVAVASILVAGVAGVAIPMVGRRHQFLQTGGWPYVCTKALAAGVILATGFVHMLSSAQEALADPCLPEVPWRKFPFSGFFAMLAALGTLLFDFLGTYFLERKHQEESMHKVPGAQKLPEEEEKEGILSISVEAPPELSKANVGDEKTPLLIVRINGHGHDHGHGHVSDHQGEDEVSSPGRHAVVSQMLELGIVSHSIIIGLSIGVSRNPSTIRPLVAALSFHQFFEGFALAGCVSQAKFSSLATILMMVLFAITTPTGIAIGAGVASFYNPNSPGALAIEGLLDSVSAGILIYLALVDLIAEDFLGHKMRCGIFLQVASFIALSMGALMMSSLAIWA